MHLAMKLVLAARVAWVATLLDAADAAVYLRAHDPNRAVGEAIYRAAAVEDVRRSQPLCRLAGVDGQGLATVRLHGDNARSLVFDDDVTGVETKVRCVGPAPSACRNATAPALAHDIGECPDCPCMPTDQLFGVYSTDMARNVEARCSKGDGLGGKTKVLMLGLGGGQLATHVVKKCGADKVDVHAVELDGRLPKLAVRYFGLPTTVQVSVSDALNVVLSLQHAVEANQLLAYEQRFDLVLVDCFSAGGLTPEHCRSPEFVKAVRAVLRDGGEVMQHLWHKDDNHPEVTEQYAATVELYNKVFACDGCTVDDYGLTLEDGVVGPDSMVVAKLPQQPDYVQ